MSTSVDITNSRIHDDAGQGIAYSAWSASTCNIRNNTIIGNGSYGIDPYMSSGNPNISNCIVWGNGGQIYLSELANGTY